MNHYKIFTLAEANKVLPKITEILLELQYLYSEIVKKQVEIDTLELIYHNGKMPKENPHHLLSEAIEQLHQSYNQFQQYITELTDLGCTLKDLQIGLIDFYANRNNELILLCWKLGEKSIQYWHPIETGFTSRQSIDFH